MSFRVSLFRVFFCYSCVAIIVQTKNIPTRITVISEFTENHDQIHFPDALKTTRPNATLTTTKSRYQTTAKSSYNIDKSSPLHHSTKTNSSYSGLIPCEHSAQIAGVAPYTVAATTAATVRRSTDFAKKGNATLTTTKSRYQTTAKSSYNIDKSSPLHNSTRTNSSYSGLIPCEYSAELGGIVPCTVAAATVATVRNSTEDLEKKGVFEVVSCNENEVKIEGQCQPAP